VANARKRCGTKSGGDAGGKAERLYETQSSLRLESGIAFNPPHPGAEMTGTIPLRPEALLALQQFKAAIPEGADRHDVFLATQLLLIALNMPGDASLEISFIERTVRRLLALSAMNEARP
jgi:hypothetical protein